MPHISKKKLQKKEYDKLFGQLTKINSKLDSRQSRAFLDSLLTDTEQVMLAKRLGCVLMLHEGYSQYAVEKTLKLSSSTVARIENQRQNGAFDSLIEVVERKKHDKGQFWKTLEVLLRGGMPSMGKERWKHLD